MKTVQILLWTFLVMGAIAACEKKNPPSTDSVATNSTKVGAELAGAAEVKVEELLKNPEAYEGKTVRVSGLVKDMCVHRFDWFSVTGADDTSMVQVLAAPRFKAPADAIGKQATAEGKVELVTLDAEKANYYMKQHKFLGQQELQPGQTMRIPTVRAFGAEFR
jgi:hypothetical protein